MIRYYTNKTFVSLQKTIKLVSLDKVTDDLWQFFTKKIEALETPFKDRIFIGIDTENTGIDPYKLHPLLLIIGDKEHQFVVDVREEHIRKSIGKILHTLRHNIIWLGANLKYDYKVLKVHYNAELLNMKDVIVQEQFLFQNMGYSNSFDSIRKRHLKNITFSSKEVREDFYSKTTKAHPMQFVVEPRHIYYVVDDIVPLFDVYDAQRVYVKKFDMFYKLDSIEFPLINVLAEMELEGFKIPVNKWEKIILENMEAQHELEIKLDAVVRNLIEKRELEKSKDVHSYMYLPYIQKRMFTTQRPKPSRVIGENLFGEVVKLSPTKNKNFFNYGSTDAITKLFGILEYPVPSKDGDAYLPIVVEKTTLTQRGTTTKLIVKNKEYIDFTTTRSEVEQFILLNPDSEVKEFYELLLKYRKVIKELDTYGDKFIQNINPITGCIHTEYRQCADEESIQSNLSGRSPVNGRLASGNTKHNYYNAQNIPRDNKFRTCFYPYDTVFSNNDEVSESKYNIITSDLSGAEVIIMADKANDKKLFELKDKDIHGHMATTGWRKIYRERVKYLYKILQVSILSTPELKVINTFTGKEHPDKIDKIINDLIENNSFPDTVIKNLKEFCVCYRNALLLVIDKENNADKRQSGKNLTFGAVYGAKPKKGARTLNIEQNEGAIYINNIKAQIPDTFNMVESNVELAKKQGYLILNSRTNSRVWFPDIIAFHREQRKAKLLAAERGKKFVPAEMSWELLKTVDGQARNIPISGTQADMIKEAMVVLHYNYIVKYNIDAKILKQVHDELVVRFNKTTYTETASLFPYGAKMLPFTKIVEAVMTDSANNYLTNFKMHVESNIEKTWVK